jgi:rare lipoprotein A
MPFLIILLLISSCAHASENGIASYYGTSRGKTASGERVNPNGLTAAHRTLPFGSIVKVTALKSGRSVIVRINDRGPFIRGRVIDLTRGAFGQIASLRSGIVRVQLEVISVGKGRKTRRRQTGDR